MARLRAVTNAPIFGYSDVFLGQGIVGGPLISVSSVGQQAANAAVRILGGEAPADINTLPIKPGTPKFDWRELQRWNISESRLPAGSEIYFRQPSPWEQYRLQIGGGLAALLLQAAIIFWLVIEHRRRYVAEAEVNSRRREVVRLNRVATVNVLSSSIAHELKLTHEEVDDHLKHLIRSARAAGQDIRVEPARCRSCGFTFSKDKILKTA